MFVASKYYYSSSATWDMFLKHTVGCMISNIKPTNTLSWSTTYWDTPKLVYCKLITCEERTFILSTQTIIITFTQSELHEAGVKTAPLQNHHLRINTWIIMPVLGKWREKKKRCYHGEKVKVFNVQQSIVTLIFILVINKKHFQQWIHATAVKVLSTKY